MFESWLFFSNVTESSFVQLANALLPIDVTYAGIITFVIVSSFTSVISHVVVDDVKTKFFISDLTVHCATNVGFNVIFQIPSI